MKPSSKHFIQVSWVVTVFKHVFNPPCTQNWLTAAEQTCHKPSLNQLSQQHLNTPVSVTLQVHFCPASHLWLGKVKTLSPNSPPFVILLINLCAAELCCCWAACRTMQKTGCFQWANHILFGPPKLCYVISISFCSTTIGVKHFSVFI